MAIESKQRTRKENDHDRPDYHESSRRGGHPRPVRKPCGDRGGGDCESYGSRFTGRALMKRRRVPDKRARFSVPHGQSVDRNTHPI
jgi:hypothetical protein